MKPSSQVRVDTRKPSTAQSRALSSTPPHGSVVVAGSTQTVANLYERKERREEAQVEAALLIKPSMTPRLKSLLENETQPVESDGESIFRTLDYCRLMLLRIEPDRLVGRITVALAHYFVPDMPEPVMRGVLEDWKSDLEEFPEWAVADGFTGWRRREAKKPMPMHIRQRCQSVVRDDREMWDKAGELMYRYYQKSFPQWEHPLMANLPMRIHEGYW